MPDLPEISEGLLAASDPPLAQIALMAGRELYLFRYQPGHEVALLSCLMDCAADPKTPIGWPEVLAVVHQLGL